MNKKTKKESESLDRPIKIFTLDTETRGLYGEVFRAGLYNGEKYYATNTIEQLKPILYNYSTKYDCHIYIHNLDFDLSKMAKEVIPNASLKDSIFINNNVTVFHTSINKTSSSEESEIISQPITFHCSSKLLPGSLAKLTEDFGLNQDTGKMDLKEHILSLGWARDDKNRKTKNPDKYNKFNSEGYYFEHVPADEKTLNEYLRKDCISLYEIIRQVHHLSGLAMDDFIKCPTTASLSMKVYKTLYSQEYEMATSSSFRSEWGKLCEGFIRSGYYGGRTEVFTPFIKDGFHYDVNSLYPFIMKTNTIPYGYYKLYNGKQADSMYRYWYNSKSGGGFIECDVHVPHDLHIPPLPYRGKPGTKLKGKLLFPVGNITGVWTYEEVELALEMGCKVLKIKQVLHFEKRDYLFKEFVEKFEKIKNTSEGGKKAFAKLIQNSLYGKFGMQRKRKTLLPIQEIERCEENDYPYTTHHHDLMGEDFIQAEIPSQADYIQPHIAAYVTSLARILLYRGLISVHKKGTVSYCDTDSIVGSEKFPDHMVDNKEYGKWKLEYKVLSGVFYQPKSYWEKVETEKGDIKEVMKFKGIPKSLMNEIDGEKTFLEIIQATINGEKEFPLIKKEKNFKKRNKFTTMLKTGELNFDMKLEVHKGVNLQNHQKRKLDFENNTSTPHVMMDFLS